MAIFFRIEPHEVGGHDGGLEIHIREATAHGPCACRHPHFHEQCSACGGILGLSQRCGRCRVYVREWTEAPAWP